MLRRTILAFALLLAACTAQQGGSGQQGNNGRPPQGQQPSIDGQPQQASGGQQAGNGQSSGNRPVATHPRCGAVSSFALPTGTRQVVLSTFQATQFELSCFGFLFRPSQSCSSTIQGAKMGRIVLNATSTDGASSVTSVDMSRLYSGSVSGTMLAFDAPMTFVMYAELLPSFVATCDINVFVSSFYAIAKPAVPTAVPVLQMAEPSIIGVGQTATLSFQLTNATAATVRFVTIPDSTAQACSTAAAAYGTAATPSVVLTAADRFNWTFSALTTSGRYRVCAWTSASQQWTVAAVLFVYGGNPAFFIASPQSSGNQQGMAQQFELRFVGTNLSAASDSIRFISNVNGGQCSASTVSDTSITVKSISTTPMGDVAAQVSVVGGNNLFRVCYYTAATSTWTEVPDFDTLPRDLLRNGTNTSNTRLPSNTSSTTTPTTTTTSCPSAPVNANFTAVTTNNVAVLTVKGSTLPSSMDANIAALLCLPETSDVTILRFEPGTTTSNVYVQVSCPTSTATTTTTKCNAAERLAALVQNAGSLSGVQAASTVSFNGLAAASNDSGHGDAGNPIVIGLAAGLASAVLVIAALVAAVFVYRHRRNARIASMTTNVTRVAYPDEEDLEIVQGDVIGFDGQREDEDNAPIPPPPEKPTKTVPMYEPSTPTHPSEVRE